MSPSPVGGRRAVGVRLRRSLSGAAAAILLALGAGGAQAAGGALDLSFGSGGLVVTDVGTESVDTAHAVVVQRDGKIVAAGWSDAETGGQGYDFALVRYTPGGKLDTTFGRGGTVLTSLGHESEVAALALQRDGRIVAVGSSTCNGDASCFALVRYTPGGKLDTSFGSDGTVLTDLGGDGGNEASAVAIQADGKIVVAGSTEARGGWHSALARYTTGGTLDRSFGSRGKVVADLGGADAVALQKDGKIVAAGNALVRYTTSGKLDPSFGQGGKVLTGPFGASAVAIRRDGKIVAAGSGDAARGSSALASDFALVRYTSRGKLDTSFGRGGKVLTDLGGDHDGAKGMAIQADGRIVAVWGYDGFALVRYTTSGKLDPSFGQGGKVLTDLGENARASAVALQKDGKIVAAGGAGGDVAVARYTP